jgi:peptide/nickel transport system substrate-binding protein
MALAALMLGLVAACSSPPAAPTSAPKPATGAAPTQPASAQKSAQAAPSGAPPASAKIKDTLTVGYSVSAEHFDAHRMRGNTTDSLQGLVYERLVTRDRETMELKPELALSWKNLDPTTWEFKLRQGVKFHNGEPFDAESVRFSFDRMVRPDANNSAKSYILGIYDSVEIVDPYTLRMKTKIPDPLWPARVAAKPLNLMPAKWGATTDEKDMAAKAVGTGPYRLMEYVPGDRSVLERNEEYWGEKGASKTLIWKTIPDVRTRLAALQRGEVDLIDNLTPELIPTVEKDSNLQIYKEMGSLTHKLIFNVSQNVKPAYLQDKRVRQALNHAVDKPALNKGLYNGMGQEFLSVLSMQMADYVAGQAYEYNPDKAKKLLAEAGYPNGFETEVWVPTARYLMGEQAVQAIADYFGKVGVKAKIMTAEWGVYNPKASAHQMETMYYYPFSVQLWEADQILGYFLKERARFNYYLPAESTQVIIRKASQEFDSQKRRDLVLQAEKLLWDETPWLSLYQLPEIYGTNKKVKGFKVTPDQLAHYAKAYVEQ